MEKHSDYQEVLIKKYDEIEKYLINLCNGQDSFKVVCGISNGVYGLDKPIEVAFVWQPNKERKIVLKAINRLDIGYGEPLNDIEVYYGIQFDMVKFLYTQHILTNWTTIMNGIQNIIRDRNNLMNLVIL